MARNVVCWPWCLLMAQETKDEMDSFDSSFFAWSIFSLRGRRSGQDSEGRDAGRDSNTPFATGGFRGSDAPLTQSDPDSTDPRLSLVFSDG